MSNKVHSLILNCLDIDVREDRAKFEMLQAQTDRAKKEMNKAFQGTWVVTRKAYLQEMLAFLQRKIEVMAPDDHFTCSWDYVSDACLTEDKSDVLIGGYISNDRFRNYNYLFCKKVDVESWANRTPRMFPIVASSSTLFSEEK